MGVTLMDKNKEVLTTTTPEGETGFMVYKTDENKNQKVCMDVENVEKIKNSANTKANSKETSMLDNNTYNLLEQLNIENKSLWRIKNNYKTDAESDNESKQFWNFVEKDKEEIVKLLTERL
jgi:acetyl-CoA carboxylase beta subunit